MSDADKQDTPTPDGSDGAAAPRAVDDDQLPEDLQPTDDNPLAQPLDPDDERTKDAEELDLQGGKPADEWDTERDTGDDDAEE